MFCKKGILRNFAKFAGKYLCKNLFFNNVVGWGLQLYQKILSHRHFPVNFEKFLRRSLLTEHLRSLLSVTVDLLIFKEIIKNWSKVVVVSLIGKCLLANIMSLPLYGWISLTQMKRVLVLEEICNDCRLDLLWNKWYYTKFLFSIINGICRILPNI